MLKLIARMILSEEINYYDARLTQLIMEVDGLNELRGEQELLGNNFDDDWGGAKVILPPASVLLRRGRK